jgi:hypothetical protein
MASIRELQIWIAEHLRTRLSVEDLADRTGNERAQFRARVHARGRDDAVAVRASDAGGSGTGSSNALATG